MAHHCAEKCNLSSTFLELTLSLSGYCKKFVIIDDTDGVLLTITSDHPPRYPLNPNATVVSAAVRIFTSAVAAVPSALVAPGAVALRAAFVMAF